MTLGQYIPGNEVSEITWGFNALFNAIMPRQSAKKTRDAPYEATGQGYYLGKHALFGYWKYKLVVDGNEHSKLEPDPEQWEHGLMVWEMGLDRYTPMETALYNNSMGIHNKKGNEWDDRGMGDFFRRPVYKGETRRGMRQKSNLIPNNAPVAKSEKPTKPW